MYILKRKRNIFYVLLFQFTQSQYVTLYEKHLSDCYQSPINNDVTISKINDV